MPIDTEEIIHVFEDHIFNTIGLFDWDKEGEQFTKQELIELIAKTKKDANYFLTKFLIPAMDRLDFLEKENENI